MDRHPKHSLDILFRCLIIFLVISFLYICLRFPWCNLSSLFLILLPCTTRTCLPLFSWSPPCKCWGLMLGPPKVIFSPVRSAHGLLGQVLLLDQLGSPLLRSLQFKPWTGCSIYMEFLKCWAEGDNHFPQLPECVPDPTAQEAAGPHWCQGAMLSSSNSRSFWKSCSPAS